MAAAAGTGKDGCLGEGEGTEPSDWAGGRRGVEAAERLLVGEGTSGIRGGEVAVEGPRRSSCSSRCISQDEGGGAASFFISLSLAYLIDRSDCKSRWL